MTNQNLNLTKSLKLNTNTILLSIVLFLNLLNGCQSCSNRNAIMQNKQSMEIQMKNLKRENSAYLDTLTKNLQSIVEINAEAQVIIEKEIDNEKILKPTHVKEMFNQYRDYGKNIK
jgi:hypothetical protein